MGNRSQEYGEYRDPEISGDRPDARDQSVHNPHYSDGRHAPDQFYHAQQNPQGIDHPQEPRYAQEPRFTDDPAPYAAPTTGGHDYAHHPDGQQDYADYNQHPAQVPQSNAPAHDIGHGAPGSSQQLDDMAWPDAERRLADRYEQTGQQEQHTQYDQNDAYDPNAELFEPLPEDDYYAAQGAYEGEEADLGDGHVGAAGVLPPHSAAEQRAAHQTSSSPRRGFFFASVIVLIMLLGGGGLYAYNMLDTGAVSGPPQIILADKSPMKIIPEGAGAAVQEANKNKLIYDRVGGSDEVAEERLIVPEETKIAELPNAGGTVDTAPTGSESRGLPRRVRTVVVRPDGTIINDEAPGVQETQTAALASPATTRGVAVPSTPLPEVTPEDGSGDITASIPNADGAAAESAASIIPTPPGSAEVPAEAIPAGSTYSGPLPKSKPSGVRLASNSAAQTAPAEPLNLTSDAQPQASAEAPPPAATEIPRGAYLVQVASQRSQEAAQSTYYSLKRRFPQILGDVNPVIQVADLGERGVYYRVRIPMGDQQAANTLCSNLKSAGGDCFVKRN
ncbi:MAG: SPOR domain-containing protein [Stappiaceae bacterium]